MTNMNFANTWKNLLGLTAAGFVGTVVFVMILIALSPILLVAAIFLLIQKIKFNHMLRKAARDGSMTGYSVNTDSAAEPQRMSKHITVTVVDESGKVL